MKSKDKEVLVAFKDSLHTVKISWDKFYKEIDHTHAELR